METIYSGSYQIEILTPGGTLNQGSNRVAVEVTKKGGELTKVVEAIELSRTTFRKIVQNLFWAWIYNVVAMPVAALGLLHPMIGVIAMPATSLSMVGNSLLLRKSGR